MFGLDFKDFNPRFGVHEEHGMSLVFNQIDPNHFEEYDLSLKKDSTSSATTLVSHMIVPFTWIS